MKNTFKLLGIIALLAIIGFSMAACDSGDTMIYGCTYSKKASAETYVTWLNPPHTVTGTHYILTITLDEAKANIVSELGQSMGWAGRQLNSSISNTTPPPYVMIEVIPESKSVRLFTEPFAQDKAFRWMTN